MQPEPSQELGCPPGPSTVCDTTVASGTIRPAISDSVKNDPARGLRNGWVQFACALPASGVGGVRKWDWRVKVC